MQGGFSVGWFGKQVHNGLVGSGWPVVQPQLVQKHVAGWLVFWRIDAYVYITCL